MESPCLLQLYTNPVAGFSKFAIASWWGPVFQRGRQVPAVATPTACRTSTNKARPSTGSAHKDPQPGRKDPKPGRKKAFQASKNNPLHFIRGEEVDKLFPNLRLVLCQRAGYALFPRMCRLPVAAKYCMASVSILSLTSTPSWSTTWSTTSKTMLWPPWRTTKLVSQSCRFNFKSIIYLNSPTSLRQRRTEWGTRYLPNTTKVST